MPNKSSRRRRYKILMHLSDLATRQQGALEGLETKVRKDEQKMVRLKRKVSKRDTTVYYLARMLRKEKMRRGRAEREVGEAREEVEAREDELKALKRDLQGQEDLLEAAGIEVKSPRWALDAKSVGAGESEAESERRDAQEEMEDFQSVLAQVPRSRLGELMLEEEEGASESESEGESEGEGEDKSGGESDGESETEQGDHKESEQVGEAGVLEAAQPEEDANVQSEESISSGSDSGESSEENEDSE
jgi:hypothetical protein